MCCKDTQIPPRPQIQLESDHCHVSLTLTWSFFRCWGYSVLPRKHWALPQTSLGSQITLENKRNTTFLWSTFWGKRLWRSGIWKKSRSSLSWASGVFYWILLAISGDQISHSVVSDSLRPHESQHARPPCPSPTPGIHSDSHPSSQWYIQPSHPLSSPSPPAPKSLPASESFPMSQLFAWGGQSTGVSALASFLPKKYQGWSPLEWTGWISLQSKGTIKGAGPAWTNAQ